jgi:hypothetical protein
LDWAFNQLCIAGNGTFKNETTPDVSNDGTPVEQQWQQDLWGAVAHLLNKVSVSPDGIQENEATSQIYDALEAAVRTLFTATGTSKGTSFLQGAMIAGTTCQIARNSGDLQNIDFSDSVWIFDDKTGQAQTAAMEKELNAAWVAGDGNGMLDTGSIAASTWYHLFHIYNPTSGASDYLASTSFAAPTLPAGYTKKRFIESILTDAGTPDIELFEHIGDMMYISNIQNSANIVGAAIVSGSAVTQALTGCAPDRVVEGIINASFMKDDIGAAGSTYNIKFSSLALANVGANTNNSQLSFVRDTADVSGRIVNTFFIPTNTSAQIRWRAGFTGSVDDELNIACHGWRKPNVV